MHTIDLISLGCSKNLVDSEKLLHLFKERGYTFHHNPETLHGDIAVVNTCGFIADAKEESIETILTLCQAKDDGELKKVYVMGCMAERYRHELEEEIPEVDGFFGKFDWPQIIHEIAGTEDATPADAFCCTDRVLTTPSHYAYIKISEGCDRTCAYCAIPLITGHHKSRREEDILNEVRSLVAQGVSEFNIIAQELTYYGVDLYGKPMLVELLRELCKIDGLSWIRMLYCYPEYITDELLDVMAAEEKIVNYLDIPIQHASGAVLERMNRRGDRAWLTALMTHIREKVPGITLRTTVMTGFPGETETDFEELCEFLSEMRLQRVGTFPFSPEEGTPAAEMPHVAWEEAVRRAELIGDIQSEIMDEFNESRLGDVVEVLCDGFDDDAMSYVGRTYAESPEIDGRVYFASDRDVAPGEFVRVKLTGTMDGELTGEVVE